jgi:hypothetical protein
MRTTRASEKRRRIESGIPDDPPKEKRMTLGQLLAEERAKEAEEILQDDKISHYEPYNDYRKSSVISFLEAAAEEEQLFHGQLYRSDRDVNIVFLDLETGDNPKTFTHLCNGSTLKWNLKQFSIESSRYRFKLPAVYMVFVRGAHVEGARIDGDVYKYLGLIGLQSVSSGKKDYSQPGPHMYLEATFTFEYVMSKKEQALFGGNLMKCRKNKYGASLCA